MAQAAFKRSEVVMVRIRFVGQIKKRKKREEKKNSANARIDELTKKLKIAKEALKECDDQMDYYRSDILVPTSWQMVHKQVKEALKQIGEVE